MDPIQLSVSGTLIRGFMVVFAVEGNWSIDFFII